MKITSFEELFHDELFDIYNAEKQITKALPKMAEAASNPKLKAGFEKHLRETEGQLKRLDQCFSLLGIKCEKETCEATKGLLKEGDELLRHTPEGPIRDAALIAAAQKVEHYEIATYGTLCAWASQLGYTDVKNLLGQTLEEEETTDETLTELAESTVNAQAQNSRQAA